MAEASPKPRWGGAPSVKCERCGKTVYPAEKVSLEQRIFHIDCIRCDNEQCSKKLNGGNFGGFIEDKAYCKHHLSEIVKQSGSGISSLAAWKPKSGGEGGDKPASGSGSRWGSRPTDKCTVCTKTVYPAEKFSVEGQIFHKDCVRCSECQKKLDGSNWGGFHEDKTYCRHHLNEIVKKQGGGVSHLKEWTPKEGSSGGSDTPSRWGARPTDKCEVCTKTVYPAEKVSMEGRIFHGPCLRCTECNKQLGGSNWGGFVGEESKPYCKTHINQLIATTGSSTGFSNKEWKPKEGAGEAKTNSRWGSRPTDKCVKCGKTVYPAEKISMEKRIFHAGCLRCTQCNKAITGANFGNFLPPNDEPYCKAHWDQMISRVGDATSISGSQTKWQSEA